MVQLLVGRGADLSAVNKRGQTSLLLSLAVNHTESAEFLLKHGRNVQVKDKHGDTALHFAVAHLQFVELIINTGEDVNTVNVDGCTALHRAALLVYPNWSAVKFLLKAGAMQVFIARVSQEARLFPVAFAEGIDYFVSLLLNKGSDANATNIQGRPCVHTTM